MVGQERCGPRFAGAEQIWRALSEYLPKLEPRNTAMGMRTFITVLLGLVFQLAQVLPGGAIPPPCPVVAKACECCAGNPSCCCAKSETPAPKPLPQSVDPGGLLKGMAMKTAETRVATDVWQQTGALPTSLAVTRATAPCAGFAGVSLAVAFCSFVI